MTILVQFTVNSTNKAIAQREESYGRHSVQFNFKAFAEFFNNDLLVNMISYCHFYRLSQFWAHHVLNLLLRQKRQKNWLPPFNDLPQFCTV